MWTLVFAAWLVPALLSGFDTYVQDRLDHQPPHWRWIVFNSADWLLYAAAVLFVAGLASYVVVLWQFDFGSVGTGVGDQWVAGGALAISTWAAAKIAASAATLAVFGSGDDSRLAAVDDVALALWCGAMAWLIPLVVSEFITACLEESTLLDEEGKFLLSF